MKHTPVQIRCYRCDVGLTYSSLAGIAGRTADRKALYACHGCYGEDFTRCGCDRCGRKYELSIGRKVVRHVMEDSTPTKAEGRTE